MKIYRVSRDKHDYDEYDAFVIRASSPEEALEIAMEAGKVVRYEKIMKDDPRYHPELEPSFSRDYVYIENNVSEEVWKDAEVIEITTDGGVGVILSSYNAG